MLNYSIKLENKYIKRDEVIWSEKYLSPDLSFVSGVTSQDYHLENLTKIEASINGKVDLLSIECKNVTREGYIVVKNKQYPVHDGTVFMNGKYYPISENKATIDNWLTPNYTIKKEYDKETSAYTEDYFVPSVKEETRTFNVSNGNVLADTIFWIESGKVSIDGNEYFFDKDEITVNGKGGLKYFEDGTSLPATGITKCSGIEYYSFKRSKDFINVTKFKLTKDEDRVFEVEDVTFINHFFYVNYNEKYYPIEIVSNKYVCKIEGTTYNMVEIGEEGTIVDNEVTTSDVINYEDLINNTYAVSLGGSCNIIVQNTVQNSNSGKKVGIYLLNSYDNINIGETITAKKYTLRDNQDIIVDRAVIEGTNKLFVVYDGTRYDVEADMIKTVTINGVEYSIKKCDDDNCFVYIDGELIPMKKISDTKVRRYGLILKGDSLVSGEYNINSYSGVTINGKDYKVSQTNSGYNLYSISYEDGIVYKFIVKEIIGSSLLVCEPLLFEDEFGNNNEFIDSKIKIISEDLVNNKDLFTFFRKNPLFGDREVLSSIPVGSEYFQDVTNTLKLYSNIGYISLPVKFEACAGINHMIDDTRDVDFVKEETQNAINPIIDMERDVYTPKFIDNSDESIAAYIAAGGDSNATKSTYIGSFTDFKPITEIHINPHFRTRNMDNWKVNDGYNNADTSGITDNWFITDYEPYRSILSATTEEYEHPENLINVPDLLGLLYFSNIDVFYQKSSLEKSFIRLSYYDGTNQQTQSLLHTSTVFTDEHSLFKKYIDNSKKNIYDYMIAKETYIEEHDLVVNDEEGLFDVHLSGDTALDSGSTNFAQNEEKFEIHPSMANKISTLTEFIGTHNTTKFKNTMQGTCTDESLGNLCYKFTDAKPEEESKRISSRFIIKNKYKTETSSEGFYIYIFKEQAENLHPKPIYMKVEYNHAKIGKTIPFNIPMKWEKSRKEISDSPYVYPTERITLSNEENTSNPGAISDLELLKDGIPLSYVYGQSYVPLYAMYDFKNKEYSYIFDDRYVDVDDNGIATLNVFELKIKNNEDADNIEKTAVININDKQIIDQ